MNESPPLMKRQPITTQQFIAWSVLVTLAFALLVVNQGRTALFALPLSFANAVIMPQAVGNARHKRHLTLIECLLVLGAVAVAAALIWWLISHRTPESEAWSRSVMDAFSHPAVAVPLWLGFLYLGYRSWRVKPPLQEELGQEPTQT